MNFIDLFAGLGGFHLALASLGHDCVFASELDDELRHVYESNFGMAVEGDIKAVPLDSIPHHDILCGGFPCQSFSKAGDQLGLHDSRFGDLFDRVLMVLEHRQPTYFLLENVPNLSRHSRGQTWQYMESALRGAGYDVDARILSPHQFGIPQIRERLFIVGKIGRNALSSFKWPEARAGTPRPSIFSVLDSDLGNIKPLSRQLEACLEVWQEFLERFPPNAKLPSFPIWSMEFGATYPYRETTPHATKLSELRLYKGSHGRELTGHTREQVFAGLPSHAVTQQAKFPTWKRTFIRQNRELYAEHQTWLDEWKEKILEFPSSLQKFEWNCQGEERSLWKFVLQVRASGVRVKRPTTAPSLIAMTATQVPIIAWEKRYMTVRECAKLQNMSDLENWPASETRAYAALGNAVNVQLVQLVATALLAPQGPDESCEPFPHQLSLAVH
jgi:DNA (cytosine-5)-methyltransferase 1